MLVDKKSSILVACERTQIITEKLIEAGYDAYSCDLQETIGKYPARHLKGDVLRILGFSWDYLLAFPPCTHLASSGARWFKEKIADGRQQNAIEFFMKFTEFKKPFLIENPVGIMSNRYRKPDQIIQPWQFGHGETKATCLWLQGFPKLKPTNIVEGRENKIWKMPPSKDRGDLRSKTYPGIAQAIVEQYFIGEK